MKSGTLKAREERRLLRGHCWAFRNEFEQLPKAEDGEVVDVFSEKRRFVARGFFQANGGIAVRLLTRRQEEIDDVFLQTRIDVARAYRRAMYPGSNVYRWIFGESDGLPGLVADRYGSVIIAQSACAFYGERAEQIANIFLACEGINGVQVSVNDKVQQFGEVPESIPVTIDDVRLEVNLADAQKTGLFLDQRDNRRTMLSYVQGARVLDGHCYVGQWAIAAAQGGAAFVHAVDTSEAALDSARAHAQLNQVADRCNFEKADVEAVLDRGRCYDTIILDPPAFAKSRAQAKKALSRYQSLNAKALEVVNVGGYLITSSCSHFVDMGDFLEMIKRAAATAQREVWVLETRGAARDHPVLLAMPETAYLKCVVLRVF
ncbi:MAG: class I SAM-dependent rRNA methyltransferase [Candidatus Hydrogenedentes bacterium]|nr:class I SAM-dependent rRNA methyltransferase [Candidatus Hydrogenedentota bacterium]